MISQGFKGVWRCVCANWLSISDVAFVGNTRFSKSTTPAATAKAVNATGTLTQPVFNDQHGLIPDRPSDTFALSQSLLVFYGSQRIVY
jgi:hypothetical protein